MAALSKQLSFPYFLLSSYSVNRETLKRIPREVAEAYLFFPFEEDENSVSIAMADPLNKEAFEAIEKIISSRVQVFITTPTEIKNCIELYYGSSPENSISGNGGRRK